MKNSYSIFLQAVLSLLLVSSFAFAAPDFGAGDIDGSMGSEWDDSATYEDTGEADEVGPGFGGQDFDIEKIGIYIDDTYLYIGLQTGFELNYEEDGYLPGDIALGFGSISTYDDYQFALEFDFGSFQGEDNFDILPERHASNEDFLTDANLNVYSGVNWSTVAFNSNYDDSPFTAISGTSEGTFTDIGGRVVYKRYKEDGSEYTRDNNDPYRNTIEMAIKLTDLSEALGSIVDLDNGFTANVFWTMECNNDMLGDSATYTPTDHTPEPATLLLFGMGLLGAGAYGRKRQRKEEK